MGEGTLEIPMELFALNRNRLVDALKTKNLGNAVVLLQGGSEINFYDTDTTYIFRQVSIRYPEESSNFILFPFSI